MHFLPHRFPADASPRATDIRLNVLGQNLDVMRHIAADYTSFECDGPLEVTVDFIEALSAPSVILRPLRHGVNVTRVAANQARFTLPGPGHYQLQVPGRPVLYLYAMAPASPAPSGPKVRRFAAGRVYEEGAIHLHDGETLWIEPGAVVRGHVITRDARDVRIGGGGVLQGAHWPADSVRSNNVLFAGCRDVLVEDLLITTEANWMLVLGGCEGVRVNRLRQIGHGHGTDGIDIVGSRDVTITGCCLHNGDDNIAIKAIDFSANLSHHGSPGENFTDPVERVRVSGCVFFNNCGGSAMEIGYETRTERISDIVFEDIDVLGVHEFGSVFGIHNGDRATVQNIRWRNIRVEHHYDKLIDFRILKSRWNFDPVRGHIRDVVISDVVVHQSIYNPGYTVSVIAGHDRDHDVQGVRLENFHLGGIHVLNADQLDLVTRHAHGVTFA
jgi:hypothetical protein